MTAPITPDERAEWRALADAATPWPWDYYRPHHASGYHEITRGQETLACQVSGGDAEFIAAARTAVPRLLDALAAAEAEATRLRRQHEMDLAMHEAYRPEVVAAWCGGTILNVQDPSGEYTSYVTIPGVGEAGHGEWIVQRHDLSFDVRAEVAGPSEESVARLAARPAPVWDEDTVTEAADEYARHNMGMRVGTYGDQLRCAFEVGATWQREHAPVQPGRETVARALRDAGLVEVVAVHEGYGAEEVIHEHLRPVVDAVLDAWPGESRATVQAEALRDAADEFFEKSPDTSLETMPSQDGHRYVTTHAWLRDRADRLDPKEK